MIGRAFPSMLFLGSQPERIFDVPSISVGYLQDHRCFRSRGEGGNIPGKNVSGENNTFRERFLTDDHRVTVGIVNYDSGRIARSIPLRYRYPIDDRR